MRGRRGHSTTAVKLADDPLAPVDFITTALLTFTLAMMLVFAVMAGAQLVTNGRVSASFLSIGEPDACVTVAHQGFGISSTFETSGSGYRRTEGISRFRGSVADYRSDSWYICLDQPTTGQYWAARVEPVGNFVFAMGALVLIRRFIRAARRHGLFSQLPASAAHHLGWFLLLFATLLPFATAAGTGVVLSAAVRGASWHDPLWGWDPSLVLVVTALGVLTMARVLARAVPLQEEVDLTV